MNLQKIDPRDPAVRDALIHASETFEKELQNRGVTEAHEWMFAVREVLYDVRRLDGALQKLYDTRDREAAVQAMKEYVEMWLYQVLPHVRAHMTDLEAELDRDNALS